MTKLNVVGIFSLLTEHFQTNPLLSSLLNMVYEKAWVASQIEVNLQLLCLWATKGGGCKTWHWQDLWVDILQNCFMKEACDLDEKWTVL